MTKKHDDPNFEKEAERYENPIPSREYIMQRLADVDVFLDEVGVGKRIGLRSKRHMVPLQKRLRAMVRDGQLVENRQGRVRLANREDTHLATVSAHPDGFGFARLDDEDHEDAFLGPKSMRGVMHGDRVRILLSPPDDRGRYEGWVSDIVERAWTEIAGRVVEKSGEFQLQPRDHRLTDTIVIKGGRVPFAAGDTVNTVVEHYPRGRLPTVVSVSEVFDQPDGLDGQITLALSERDMPSEFSEAQLAAANSLGVAVTDADKAQRLDLRDLQLVTIDGEDSRDFDDAVYAEQNDDGWTLWVAIADVAHYVQAQQTLDQAAYERGTSVYFPDRVIPMLPEGISNGLCSLNPKVDRLCVVAKMQVDRQGELQAYEFADAVMHSAARLTYTEVNAALFENDAKTRKALADVLPSLTVLGDLFQALQQAREVRGAMDFDSVEPRFIFGEDKTIESIEVTQRNDAHRLIEACMITANVAAAKYLESKKYPALMRIHQGPKLERVENLRAFLATKALQLGGGDTPSVHDYAALAKIIAERPDALLLQSMLLRSMNQAQYVPDDDGHFGLALDAYAHFTSPIRRYPDLTIHRMIKHSLGDQNEAMPSHGAMVEIGEHCSFTERRADEAVREVEDWLKCEYMSHHVGDEFDGIVAAVTAFGVFVTLDGLYIDGLIHVTQLPEDYYDFDQASMTLVGRRTSRVIGLGQAVRVKVVAVGMEDRRIDLKLVSELEKAPRNTPRPEKSGGKKKARTPKQNKRKR